MSFRETAFAALVGISATFVVIGAAHITSAAGWIVGGVLLAAWSWLVLGDA